MIKVESFKFWLYELDEQELCDGREKIMKFVKSLEKPDQLKGRDKLSPPLAEGWSEEFDKTWPSLIIWNDLGQGDATRAIKAFITKVRADMKEDCIKVAEEFEQPNCDCGTENPKSHYSNCVEGNYSDSEAIVRRLKALK